MKGKKKDKWLLAVVLIVLTVLLAFKEAHYHYEISGSAEQAVWQEDGNERQWTYLTVPLTEGDYLLTFEYTAFEEVQWNVIDGNQNDGKNHIGKTLQTGMLSPEEHAGEIPIHLSQDTDEVKILFRSAYGDITVGDWSVVLQKDDHTDGIVLVMLADFCVFVLYFLGKDKKYRGWFFIFLLGIAVTIPYFGSFLQYGHDISFHLARIEGIARGLQNVEFPVRMNSVMNQGAGFLDFIYYPSLFLYPAGILRSLGVSLLNCYKILILGINLGTSFLGYLAFKKLLRSERLGFFCTLLYVLNPYHLVNLYLRAAVGELLAAMFLPLLLYGIYELFWGNWRKWGFTAAAATGLIQSHILSVELSVLFTLLAGIACVGKFLRKEEAGRLVAIVKTGLTVVLANLWFLMPLLLQMGRKTVIVESKYRLSENAVEPIRMFQSFFRMMGENVPNGSEGEMPQTIGVVLLVGAVTFIYYAFIRKNMNSLYCRMGFVCLVMGILSCFVASNLFPWDAVQSNAIGNMLLGTMQYPWRMLGFAALFLCVVSTLAADCLYKNHKNIVVYIMSGITLLMAGISMCSYIVDGETYLSGRNQAVPSPYYIDYYDPGLIPETLWNCKNYVQIEGQAEISSFKRKGFDLEVLFANAEDGTVFHLPLYDYNVYKIYLNEEAVAFYDDENQYLTVEVPDGIQEGKIEVKYCSRRLYRVFDLISAGFLLIFLLQYLRRGKERK